MQYIALLRGINVSGHKIIKMAELRNLLENAGLKNVQTYIQSGNIVFESSKKREELGKLISNSIHQEYGFVVPTFILKPKELQAAVDNNPHPEAEGNKLYLTFFTTEVNDLNLAAIQSVMRDTEEVSLIDNVLFFHCPEGASKSKLSNNLVERKMEASATSRNIRSCHKLLELAKKTNKNS